VFQRLYPAHGAEAAATAERTDELRTRQGEPASRDAREDAPDEPARLSDDLADPPFAADDLPGPGSRGTRPPPEFPRNQGRFQIHFVSEAVIESPCRYEIGSARPLQEFPGGVEVGGKLKAQSLPDLSQAGNIDPGFIVQNREESLPHLHPVDLPPKADTSEENRLFP
jgi:hypothetical protein